MKISLNWLKESVEVSVEPSQLKSDLTTIGLNVESLGRVGEDWVFEVEVTTNRPDCLSHYGIGREVSTLYEKPLRQPKITVKESSAEAAGEVSIEILDPELCVRYCGRVIRGVRIKPSPAWLARRLEAVGMHPINNVADVTNYVLLELGHPLHAFDLARLQQKKILVRRAKPGEQLRTLDGVNRTLTVENLVIADAERPVALAGVMGGEDSEISSATRDVLLESAWFDPVSVRRTAKGHGMHTEASHRFERGADVEMAPVALDRAAALIQELAGGEILRDIVDVFPVARSCPEIVFRRSELLRLLGEGVHRELGDNLGREVERILRSLGFRVEPTDEEGWRVVPPSFRLHVTREVDLIEEFARHYGYDRLPARLRPAPPRVQRDLAREKELTLSAILVGLGYREIIASSMADPDESARFTERPPVVLANPLSQEASALRSSPVPSMLRALRWNLDRDQTELRFFEVGKTYSTRPRGLPDERRVLTLGLTGHRHPQTVHEPSRELDFFDLKGDLEMLFEAFAVGQLRFEPDGCHYYEADLGGQFIADGIGLAVFGQLSRALAREYKLRQSVWIAEVDLEKLLGFSLKARIFRAYSKFPAVERDFSLVIPDDVTFRRVEEAIRGLAQEEIQNFRPVDLFRGESITAGHYSLLLRVTFQSQDRTLTSEEVDEASRRLLSALEPLGVRLRT